MSYTYILGITNGVVGTGLSAAGYAQRKWWYRSGGKTYWWVWWLLIFLGAVSSLFNFALLSASAQAPFPCFTIIWSMFFGTCFLHESFLNTHLWSFIWMSVGILLMSLHTDTSEQSFKLEELEDILLTPIKLVVFASTVGGAMLFFFAHSTERIENGCFGFSLYTFWAGIFSGFSMLGFKTLIEVLESYTRGDDQFSFLVIAAALIGPVSLYCQIRTLDLSIQRFDASSVSAAYSCLIVLNSAFVGFFYLDEGRHYDVSTLCWYFWGVCCILRGVYLTSVVLELEMDEEKFLSMKPSYADPIEIFESCDRMQEAIIELIEKAEKTIHYSYFLCDFRFKLNGTEKTMLQLLNDASERGVIVKILANPFTEYGTTSIEELQRDLHADIMLNTATGTLGPSAFEKAFSSNEKYGYHHQKYLCIDGKEIMVTGTDVNDEREAWMVENGVGYFWHELGVLAHCTEEILQWCDRNHEDIHIYPPLPISCGEIEHDYMCNMILNAKESIHIENQILMSGLLFHKNRIMHAIAHRIVKAVENSEKFHVVVVTNTGQPDEPSLVAQILCPLYLKASLAGVCRLAMKAGISKENFEECFVACRLSEEKTDKLIKVHTNILIVDQKYALRSSSNLSDRSWSDKPTDTELGIFIEGEQVTKLLESLIHKYVGDCGGYEDFFNAVKRGVGNTSPFEIGGFTDRMLADLGLTFLYDVQPKPGGGIEQNHWNVSTVDTSCKHFEMEVSEI